MRSSDLSAEQLERIEAALGGFMHYLVRLSLRMEEYGFLADDRLFRNVTTTHAELHTLLVHLHHQACDARKAGSREGTRRTSNTRSLEVSPSAVHCAFF